jgi:hypothetical protein
MIDWIFLTTSGLTAVWTQAPSPWSRRSAAVAMAGPEPVSLVSTKTRSSCSW